MKCSKEQIVDKLTCSHFDTEKTDLFSSQHMMTNKELIGQAWSYTAEIQHYYLSDNTPICIGVRSVASNGVRIVVAFTETTEHLGYACTIHAVSRRNKIIEHICDMFEAGCSVLSDDDWDIIPKD